MTTFTTGRNINFGEKILDRVEFFSFSDAPSSLKAEWEKALRKCVEESTFIGGNSVKQFEESWSNVVSRKFSIGVGNGLDGLAISLRALGIGPGMNVAVPAHTFIATWLAIDSVGANPIGIDIDDFGLIDLNELEITNQSFSAVIPVHMHGLRVDMNRLLNWTSPRNIKVIEDSSQAHQFIKRESNSLQSDIEVYSLYPSKNLGAFGDAGILSTDDEGIAKFVREHANYGSSVGNKYQHLQLGTNSRLDTIQASILNVNLKYLSDNNNHRRQLAKIYFDNLDLKSHNFLHRLESDSVFHHFAIKIEERDSVKKALHERGVNTEVHYPLVAGSEYARISEGKNVLYKKSQLLADSILSLPMSQWMPEKKVLKVCSIFNEVASNF